MSASHEAEEQSLNEKTTRFSAPPSKHITYFRSRQTSALGFLANENMAATKEELAILLDRIALLEKRLDVPHQKEVTVTENSTSSAIVESHDSV